MRAIVLEKFGGLDSLVYKDIPEPEPLAGYVVIQVKAFGLNHAEMQCLVDAAKLSQIDDDVADRLRAANENVAISGLLEWLRSVGDGP